jgi:UDP-N-acetylglucosamine:LPS N-acetylglucosamine transferase
VSQRAIVLSGSLGLGHDAIADRLASTLDEVGWESRTLDCMGLLGRVESRVGDQVFRWLSARPSLYDSLHFAHFRPGTRLAMAMDRSATKRLVPAVEAVLDEYPAEVVISAFPTGASTAAKLSQRRPDLRTAVLCTDACLHRLWVWPETDLFLVTSEGAAASVRRYLPRARIALVPPPVRDEFFCAGSQASARRDLGIPAGSRCVLVMGGGWGLGPLAAVAEALAGQGVHVLAVAGRNRRLEANLTEMARSNQFIHPFGFTDQIPKLMAAADLVVSTPGATTCSEARVVGRRLVLLDVLPGHGRENLQQQLAMGHASACDAAPSSVTATVLAALECPPPSRKAPRHGPGDWQTAIATALGDLHPGEARTVSPPLRPKVVAGNGSAAPNGDANVSGHTAPTPAKVSGSPDDVHRID